jgi:hypothetical protein
MPAQGVEVMVDVTAEQRRRWRGWGCPRCPDASASTRASKCTGLGSGTQERLASPTRAVDTGQQPDAPARGRAGSRRCSWGGRCRLESVRACTRTRVQDQGRPSACTTGRKDHPDGGASAHGGETPTSSVRSEEQKGKGWVFPSQANACACAGARARGCALKTMRAHTDIENAVAVRTAVAT